MTYLKGAAMFLLCLVVGDVAGVVACVVLDISGIRGFSTALPYAVWLVVGIFVGVTAMGSAGSWISGKGDRWVEGPEAAVLAPRIFLSGLVTTAALGAFFWWLWWRFGGDGEYFVPDSMPHSIVYLLSALAGMWVGRLAFTPARKA